MVYQDNPIIKKRFEEKMARFNKQDLSIQFCWSVNASTNFLLEKEKGTEKGFKKILKWYPRFLAVYREFMLEHLPPEPVSEAEAKQLRDWQMEGEAKGKFEQEEEKEVEQIIQENE